MPNPSILIWDGCAPAIEKAIHQLQKRWRPSSTGSSKHTLRLVVEFIDPAISEYVATLPNEYRQYTPGADAECFSSIIQKFGLHTTARLQRAQLNNFRPLHFPDKVETTSFVATLETLIGLVDAFIRKESRKDPDRRTIETAKVRDTPLSNTRRKGLCRFCGAPAEFTSFTEGSSDVSIYPLELTKEHKQRTLRLSSQYCLDHRPKFENSTWNPEYQKAKRSEPEFNRELKRLSLQSASLGEVNSGDNVRLVEGYIYHYVRLHGFQPADEEELRHHARLMVNSKLSDRKKSIVLLSMYGLSQAEIARRIGLSRQTVSKDLASIPHAFARLPTVKNFLLF